MVFRPGRCALATKTYVLIETAVGKTREVATQLRDVGGIKDVDVVTGPYDIIALIEAEDINSIGDIVTGKVHTIGGVVRTVTCVAVAGIKDSSRTTPFCPRIQGGRSGTLSERGPGRRAPLGVSSALGRTLNKARECHPTTAFRRWQDDPQAR